MARPKRTQTNNTPVPPSPVIPEPQGDKALPYPLRRELEEISKSTGRAFDLSMPVEELEAICNAANYPPDSWRHRWS